MDSDFYTTLNQYFWSHDRLRQVVVAANRMVTVAVFLAYPALLVYLWLHGVRDTRFVVIPAASFVAVSIVRSHLHRKRPYEVLPITPLASKDTKEKSFPSRHVFSAFMVAMTCLGAAFVFQKGEGERGVLLFGAVVLFILADLLGDLRILMGVHFLGDTVAGALIAVFCGFLYFL